jgi:hypothetical protein
MKVLKNYLINMEKDVENIWMINKEKIMDISGVKKKSDAGDFRDYPEPKIMSTVKEQPKESNIDKLKKWGKERGKKKLESQKKKLAIEQKKSAISQKRLGIKSETERLKAEIAASKKLRRESSPISAVGKGFRTLMAKGSDIKERASYEKSRLGQDVTRHQREKFRKEQDIEREYHRKFPVKNEGEGELPYYEKEYLRPLPKKELPCTVTKKKSLKEELF